MNDDRSFERTAREWLELGANQAPDRAVQSVLLAIETTPQERDLRIPWRFPTMNTPLRVGMAAIIGLLLLGGAIYVFGGGGWPEIGAHVTPTPTPNEVPSGAVVSPGSSPTAKPGSLSSGLIMLEHFGHALDGSEATNLPELDVKRVYMINADGTGLHEFLPGQPSTGKLFPGWSPDGTRIVFADRADHPQIWEADLAGGSPRLISTPCDCGETMPSYAPDGKRIAFVRYDGKVAQIVVRDLASGEETRLRSTAREHPETPSTTAGSIAAFGKTAAEYAHGGGLSDDTWAWFPERPAWSPDGRQIVYAGMNGTLGGQTLNEGATNLFIVDVETDAERTILVRKHHVADASWSPYGSLLVFASRPLHSTGAGNVSSIVHTIKLDGTDFRSLTNECCSGAPSWTPDGRILYLQSGEGEIIGPAQVGTNGLWLMDATGSNQRPLSPTFPDLASDTNGWAYFGTMQP